MIQHFPSSAHSTKEVIIIHNDEKISVSRDDIVDAALYVSCEVVKNAAFLAYTNHGRSTTSVQIINSLEHSFKQIYEKSTDAKSSL